MVLNSVAFEIVGRYPNHACLKHESWVINIYRLSKLKHKSLSNVAKSIQTWGLIASL